MPKVKTLQKKLVKTSSEIDKLLKSKRFGAIQLCVILATDLKKKMGEDKFMEKLSDENVSFETKNYFDAAETIEDKPSEWNITNILTDATENLGIETDSGTLLWSELATDVIVKLADALSDIHAEMQKHI